MKFVSAAVFLLCLPAVAEPRSVIVEFHDSARASTDLHQRLRTEVRTAGFAASSSGATQAAIVHEYHRTLAGASLRNVSPDLEQRLRQLPYVKAVHDDPVVHELSTHEAVSRPGSTRVNSGGNGVTIAIIDTGIDYHHEAFGGAFGPGQRVIGGWDFVNGDADPMDDRGHGTHVAGIAAGNGGGVSGIAPQARILAYKVLNAQGQGSASNIIAALERAIDPNADGDSSDHADVINLSLGGPGGADDPLSRAVDAASAAGAVVCVAAGNSGEFYDIGSPAGARTAITVGAADNAGVLAEFSTRGPAVGGMTMKPEVLAPGVSISSAAAGGGSTKRSGTSMASPYVAGIAALLVEAHPDWTPARIRSAIINTAIPVDDDVMAHGAGNVSLTRSIDVDAEFSPAAISFGIVPPRADGNSVSAVVRVTNLSTLPRRYSFAGTAPRPGITIEVAPTDFEVAAGTSADVTLVVALTERLPDPGPSFAYGGHLRITDGSSNWVVPWSFVYTSRATTTFSGDLSTVTWTGTFDGPAAVRQYAANAFETLLPAGNYSLAMAGRANGTDVLLAYGPQLIEGDVRIARTLADAPHTLRLQAADSSGNRLHAREGSYRATARLLMPRTSVEIPELASPVLRVSPLDDEFSLLLTEHFVDISTREVTVAQHPIVRNVTSDRDLVLAGSDYDSRHVTLTFPDANASRFVRLIPRSVAPRDIEAGRAPLMVDVPARETSWTGRIVMSRETHTQYASGLSMFAFDRVDTSGGPTALLVPTIRRDTTGFFSTQSATRPRIPVAAVDGEDFRFGHGALRPFFRFEPSGRLYVVADVLGLRGESRRKERAALTYSVTAAGGIEVAGGPTNEGVATTTLPGDGDYTLRFETHTQDATRARGTALLGFDTRRDDAVPPNLTSLTFLDAAGRHISRGVAGRTTTLVFSAGDFSFHTGYTRYTGLADEYTRAWWRRHGETAWQPLTVRRTGEDRGPAEPSSIPAPGMIYEVDLIATAAVAAPIDLRIDIADAAGNTLSWTMEPALPVDAEGAPGRHRAIR
jgi:hypothetical protein